MNITLNKSYLQKIIMKFNLNLLKDKRVDVYLYANEHVVIPWRNKYKITRDTLIYGSSKITIEASDNTSYRQKFFVRKNKVVLIDKKGQRCNVVRTQETPGKCVVKKFEDTFNCTTYQLMANKSKEFCSSGQLSKFNKAISKYSIRKSEAELLKHTGCLPDCERFEMSLQDVGPVTWPEEDPIMSLYFLFEDGSYSVGEEYIVYDTSNFIADVGGYLGLLVGQSILGLYYWSAEWLAKLKI